MTEKGTKHEGDLSYLTRLSEQVSLIEDQIMKWRHRLPELTDDESKERVVSAVEVKEELDELKETVLRKLRSLLTKIGTLEESIQLLENDREEPWEAISNKVITMVGDSVGSLTERLTELEHAVRSQGTTPVTDDDVLNMETWSTMEQATWSELGTLREHAQEVPNLYTFCEKLYENQKAQDKQIARLREFARQVEQFLSQMSKGKGATAPKGPRETPALERENTSVPLEYVPGASASSSNRPPLHIQTPKPPTVPAPPIPQDAVLPTRENSPSCGPSKGSSTQFSTLRSEVRSGAIRIDITDPEQWSAGDVAVIRNQEAKKVRDIGSLIFETPIQHNYEAGVEVRSLLPSEQLEEVDGRVAVLDVDPSSGTRFVRFLG